MPRTGPDSRSQQGGTESLTIALASKGKTLYDDTRECVSFQGAGRLNIWGTWKSIDS